MLNIYKKENFMNKKPGYGCSDYRKEMTLLSLKRRLNDKNLSNDERYEVELLIGKLEKEMNLN